MAENESGRAFEVWREASGKFDYFMAGLSAAIVGYIAPTLEPSRLGLNPSTLELISMLVLIGSVFAAFKRIESTVHLQRLAVVRLEKVESVQRLSMALRDDLPVADSETQETMERSKIAALLENRRELLDEAKKVEELVSQRAVRWYSVRYYLLVAGFVLLLAARVWKAYA